MAEVDRPVELLNTLGAQWSPDFEAYAAGELPLSEVRCVLCHPAPCRCGELSAKERLALE